MSEPQPVVIHCDGYAVGTTIEVGGQTILARSLKFEVDAQDQVATLTLVVDAAELHLDGAVRVVPIDENAEAAPEGTEAP